MWLRIRSARRFEDTFENSEAQKCYQYEYVQGDNVKRYLKTHPGQKSLKIYVTTYLLEHKKQDAVNLKVIQLPDLLHVNSAPSVFIKGIEDPGQLFLGTKLIMLSSIVNKSPPDLSS